MSSTTTHVSDSQDEPELQIPPRTLSPALDVPLRTLFDLHGNEMDNHFQDLRNSLAGLEHRIGRLEHQMEAGFMALQNEIREMKGLLMQRDEPLHEAPVTPPRHVHRPAPLKSGTKLRTRHTDLSFIPGFYTEPRPPHRFILADKESSSQHAEGISTTQLNRFRMLHDGLVQFPTFTTPTPSPS
ncbi:hypothetical protein Hypma_000600 [Hypsizygus marmoreus]|uniref:Uncharacterized protein n=1 Tax=Hypsizygus marmoreus TaxID=39966 RepID=A0A369J842_HYPMA|nr:hypothetical protein Hypma_000600 [Hypsizygus marmoreus]